VSDAFTEAVKALRAQGRDGLVNALVEQGRTSASPPLSPAPQFVGQPRDEDEAWQIAASKTAWGAIKAARAHAGRPIE
jgi:hypothetical protein